LPLDLVVKPFAAQFHQILISIVGLHPVGQVGLIQVFAFLEEFQPALLLGLDPFGHELVQFQQPDAAVVE